jgi:hypothetical protein
MGGRASQHDEPARTPTQRPRCTVGGGVAALLLFAAAAAAQTPASDGSYYLRQQALQIPFQTDQGAQRIQQVQLYLSQDQGRKWQQVATAQPTERFFRFQAQQDGWYWFAVRTVDFEGRGYPQAVEQLQPGLKVCVDTQRPVVMLRPTTPPEGGAGVEWQISDENIDLDSIRLDQRTPGAGDWQSLGAQRVASGNRAWNPGTNAPLEVRLQVRDKAGNLAEATTNVTPTPATGGVGRPPVAPPAAASGPRRVNSKRISLNYELRDVGKSGVAVVELWYTRDPQARTWQKHDERANAQPPYLVDVTDEGLYGFTLVARSGVGLGEQPPRVGDQPQIWVEVDLTKPRVQLLNVDVGRGQDTGNLTITWSASDKNLGPRSITLSYADKLEGPWTPIAAGEENTGRYVWRMPAELPYQLHIKVEAVDLAGNVGSAETSRPVAVDLSVPKIRGIVVEPGK